MIDYIIETTKNEKIFYIGHSQGATVFFVLLSEHPEYNDKIKAMVALAPVTFSSHMKSPLYRLLAKHASEIHVRTIKNIYMITEDKIKKKINHFTVNYATYWTK